MNRSTRSRLFSVTLGTAVLALSIAACGTTVRDPNAVSSGPGGLVAPGTSGVALQSGAPSLGSSGVSGGSSVGPIVNGSTGATFAGGTGSAGSSSQTGPGSGTASSTGPTSAGSSTSTTGGGAITTGTGRLAPVEVGMVYIPDADAFTKLVGGSGTVGNELTEAKAAVAWVNSHGGLNGHPIVPEYYSQSALNTAPYSTMMASICDSWTQDHHVIAGMTPGTGAPNDIAQCLNANNVTYLSGSTYLHDDADYVKYPHFFSPYEAPTDQVMDSLLKYLISSGKLTSKSKVGVLLADNEPAAMHAYQDVVVPMLKAHHISVGAYNVEFPASTVAAASALTEVSNDQLHMRSDGVTNVVFLAPGGAPTFLHAANGQGWKPQYALTSYDALKTVASTSPAVQTELAGGATAIGWWPSLDVGTYGNNAYSNSETKLCDSIEDPTGQVTSYTSQANAYAWCDELLSLRDAAIAEGVTTNLTGNDLTNGFTKIGERTSAIALGTDLTATHHAGVSEYRPMAYSTSCKCFQYTGGLAPLS